MVFTANCWMARGYFCLLFQTPIKNWTHGFNGVEITSQTTLGLCEKTVGSKKRRDSKVIENQKYMGIKSITEWVYIFPPIMNYAGLSEEWKTFAIWPACPIIGKWCYILQEKHIFGKWFCGSPFHSFSDRNNLLKPHIMFNQPACHVWSQAAVPALSVGDPKVRCLIASAMNQMRIEW